MRSTPLIAFALLVFARGIAATDWPQFRGPDGAGVYAGGSLPADLSKESASWSVEVPFGRSSPVVVGDRVYVTGSEGDDRLTLAFRRSDGRQLWRHVAKRTTLHERVESRNDPASPTPAADGSGVISFFPDIGLVGVDVNGRERWRVPLGPLVTAYWMASSPVLVDGLVIQACDQQAGSFLVAVDRRTGRVRWRFDRPEMREGWYTPLVLSANGRKELVVPGSARIEGLDVQT